VRLYLALETQWRVETASLFNGSKAIVFTRRHGIDYGAVPIAAAGLGLTLTPGLWALLQIAEREALVIYDRREEAALGRA